MTKPDVIVVGAGAAGLVATRDLTRAGARVLLLEARDRLGGRIWTRHTPEGPIELGAEFVHGADPEVLGIAKEAGLPLHELERSAPPASRAEPAPREEMMSAIDSLLAHASAGEDESFQHLVDRVDADPAAKARALAFVGGYHAADPAKISVQALVDNTAADEGPGSERQFRFANGYDGLVAALQAQAVSERCSVQRNTVVKAITWRPRQVVLRTSSGEELTAPQIVVTIPVSLLKAGAIEFSPRLPEKEDAIRRIEMGAAARVCLQFEGDAWNQGGAFEDDGFLMTGEAPFAVWWVSRPAPSAVVTGWVGGRGAQALAALDEAGRVSAGLEGLGAALAVDPNRLREELRRGFSYGWEHDPFARGAYSYAGVGGRRAGSELAIPVEGTVFFAGEATQSDGRNATVHGAIASGQRAAQQAEQATGAR